MQSCLILVKVFFIYFNKRPSTLLFFFLKKAFGQIQFVYIPKKTGNVLLLFLNL